MVIEFSIEGYNELIEKLEELAEIQDINLESRIFIFFTSGLGDSGIPWCPDCIAAEMIVREEVKNLKEDDIFLNVNVGLKEYWKNPECPFRIDHRFLLTWIPTLLLWGGEMRLELDECCDVTLVSLLFNETI